MTRMVSNDGMKPHLAKEQLFAKRTRIFSDEGLGLEPINRGLKPHSTHSLNRSCLERKNLLKGKSKVETLNASRSSRLMLHLDILSYVL